MSATRMQRIAHVGGLTPAKGCVNVDWVLAGQERIAQATDTPSTANFYLARFGDGPVPLQRRTHF